MSRDQSHVDKVFSKLDSLRKKYERAERLRISFHGQIKNCYGELEWRNDKDLIEEIIDHLPIGYPRLLMYEQLGSLLEAEEAKAGAVNGAAEPQEGGGDDE